MNFGSERLGLEAIISSDKELLYKAKLEETAINFRIFPRNSLSFFMLFKPLLLSNFLEPPNSTNKKINELN